MSNAREILDERLAKGEISVIEHAELAARLGGKAAAQPSGNVKVAQSGSSPLQIAGGIVVAIVVAFGYANWKMAAELKTELSNCTTGGAFTPAQCQCLFTQVEGRINVTWYLPIIGKMMQPNDLVLKDMFRSAGERCV